MSFSWWWQRLRGNVETCKAFWSQGSEWCVIISAYLLLHVRRTAQFQGEGLAGSASLGRGTQITWQRALAWIQGGAKNPGPLRCRSTTPGHCCWRWRDSTERGRLGSLPLGSPLWWRRWWRWRRDSFVQSLRRTVATVGPTWTSAVVIATVLAGFSALMGPASPVAMEGCWVSSEKKESSLQEVCREAWCPLRGLLSYRSACSRKSNQRLLPLQNGGCFNWDIGRCIFLISA